MTTDHLRALLTSFGLSQADFARLIGVTPRAVTLWLNSERTIPGAAKAYLRVFELLPPNLRQIELNRLKEKGTAMRDGMFGMVFQSTPGNAGMGMLVLDNGRVYGTDTEGVRYDGTYLFNEHTGIADIKAKVTFPPNVRAVFGVSNPYEWAFDITASFNPKQNKSTVKVSTSLGQPITAQIVYLRALPEAA